MIKTKKILLLLLFLFPIFLYSACTQKDTKTAESDQKSPDIINNSENQEADHNNDNPRYIIMMGRSVMNDWFQHWVWDGESPIQLDRYTLEYHELSTPPEITNSVRDVMHNLPDNKKDIIFFKFCFEDFEGNELASENLERNKKIIEDVYNIVVEEYGAELIVGNALPKVISETDIYLVWNHQQFISWLNNFWRENPDHLTVFDMYNPITNDLGALKEDYAVSSDDSHLNDSAYNLLDEKFFAVLNSIY